MRAKSGGSRARHNSRLWPLRALLFLLCAPKRMLESTRILRGIQAGDGAHPRVQRTTLAYRSRGRSRSGDLYRADDPRAGLVLVPGVTLLGKEDPRLIAFAQALARAHFEVLVPDLPGLKNLRVCADDAGTIADALSALSLHRAAQGNTTVGLIAICYSTGPAMIALLDERIRGVAQFMLAIGGYYDIEAVIGFITTGRYRNPVDGTECHRVPDEYGKWVFAISNADALENEQDRELLDSMARRRLDDDKADISDLASGLSDEGRRVYALLENRDPERVAALIASLPRHVVDEIAKLDLKRRDFSGLEMRFILIHGNDDAIIPETESIALARALPGADVFILNSMRHVDPGPAGFADKLKMLAAIQGLLQERDKVRPPGAPVAESPLQPPAGPCGES